MKRIIKKLFSLFLICLLAFSLSSCIPVIHQKSTPDNITEIEIYYFSEPVTPIDSNGNFISVQIWNEFTASDEPFTTEELNLLLLEYSNYTPICIIEESLYNELENLLNLVFHHR